MPDDLIERARAAAAKAGNVPAVQPVEDEPPPDELLTHATARFPVGVLPRAARDWVLADSEHNQVPLELSGTFALMAMMTAGMRCDVQIGPDWREPCVSQMLLIASPSERKSPSYRKAFAPLREHYKRELARIEREKQLRRNRIAELDRDVLSPPKKGTAAGAEREALAKEIEEMPSPRRRLAGDVTPEELMRLLNDNDQTLCLSSDDGGSFGNFAGRYSSEGGDKLQPLLMGWDCGYLPYDRVGHAGKRINIVLDAPRVGVAVAGQYVNLSQLIENPIYRSKGLLARLMYVVLPGRSKERPLTPAAPDPLVRDRYCDMIEWLMQRTVDTEGPLTLANRRDYGNGWLQPEWLMAIRKRVEIGTLGDGEFADVVDWAGKLVSNLARMAAVLELAGGGGEQHLADLADFFVAHAQRAMASSSNAPQRGTEAEELSYLVTRLVEKARSGPRAAGRPANLHSRRFRMRDLLRLCKRFKSNAAMEPRLNQLVEMGHLRELPSNEAMGLGYKSQARIFVLSEQLTRDPADGGWNPGAAPLNEVRF